MTGPTRRNMPSFTQGDLIFGNRSRYQHTGLYRSRTKWDDTYKARLGLSAFAFLTGEVKKIKSGLELKTMGNQHVIIPPKGLLEEREGGIIIVSEEERFDEDPHFSKEDLSRKLFVVNPTELDVTTTSDDEPFGSAERSALTTDPYEICLFMLRQYISTSLSGPRDQLIHTFLQGDSLEQVGQGYARLSNLDLRGSLEGDMIARVQMNIAFFLKSLDKLYDPKGDHAASVKATIQTVIGGVLGPILSDPEQEYQSWICGRLEETDFESLVEKYQVAPDSWRDLKPARTGPVRLNLRPAFGSRNHTIYTESF